MTVNLASGRSASVAPVFCAAHLLESWDDAQPQVAFVELAGTDGPTRAEGTLVVAGREELAESLHHPAVRATDGVHYNVGAERPLIPLGPVDLMMNCCLPLPTQVFIDLLGLPLADLPAFLDFREAVVRPVGDTVDEQRENMGPAGRRMSDYLDTVLEQRRQEPPRDDLIDGFMHTETDGERLTDTEILDICYLLVIAGLGTVTSSLACFLAWFAEHSTERAAVVADPTVLPRAIEELLPFESPVPLAHRRVTEDIVIRGRTFPAGSMVEVLWAAASVEPAAFPDPLTVDFGRQRNAHVAFAAGPHRCLGPTPW